MGLRQQAATDLRAIVEDGATGFGWPVTVVDPLGATATVTGRATDIGYAIDPSTGTIVRGRKASVALTIASLTAAGLDMPYAVADSISKPWRVTTADASGTQFTYAVLESIPDRAAGLVVLILEAFQT